VDRVSSLSLREKIRLRGDESVGSWQRLSS